MQKKRSLNVAYYTILYTYRTVFFSITVFFPPSFWDLTLILSDFPQASHDSQLDHKTAWLDLGLYRIDCVGII